MHYCCDRKARAASAQSFALWQQATIEITRSVHFIIACSRYAYIRVFLRALSVRGEPRIPTQRQRSGCNTTVDEEQDGIRE